MGLWIGRVEICCMGTRKALSDPGMGTWERRPQRPQLWVPNTDFMQKGGRRSSSSSAPISEYLIEGPPSSFLHQYLLVIHLSAGPLDRVPRENKLPAEYPLLGPFRTTRLQHSFYTTVQLSRQITISRCYNRSRLFRVGILPAFSFDSNFKRVPVNPNIENP